VQTTLNIVSVVVIVVAVALLLLSLPLAAEDPSRCHQPAEQQELIWPDVGIHCPAVLYLFYFYNII